MTVVYYLWLREVKRYLRSRPQIIGSIAQPLLYLLVRTSFGRAEAFFAGAMLTVSYWHLLYSRVAHWSISYGTVILGVLLLLMLGRNRVQRGWFIAAGALLGLGIYTYNIYPIAVIAVFAFVAIMWFAEWRHRDDRGWWLRSLAWFAGAAFVVALPMLKSRSPLLSKTMPFRLWSWLEDGSPVTSAVGESKSGPSRTLIWPVYAMNPLGGTPPLTKMVPWAT